jgi:hypothetical protein
MSREKVLAMNSGNGNSFLRENSLYSHSQNEFLAYQNKQIQNKQIKIEYKLRKKKNKKEYCVFCNEKTFEPFEIELDIYEFNADLQISFFIKRKTIKPLCWYCGMLIMKIIDKINEK